MYPDFMEKVRSLYKNDLESQKHYLSVLGEGIRNLPFEVFEKYEAFFVPNDDYLRIMWGESCALPEYDIYSYEGFCYLNNCIIFPCKLLNGQVVGWVSFNPFIKMKAMETGEYTDSYYSYPTSRVFHKSDGYIFMHSDVYRKSLVDGYIIITDGVFDTISLTYYGLNACSALGSSLTLKSAFPLRFIDKVYVSMDNDDAGLRFLENIRKVCGNVRYLKQGFSGDIDDILKTSHKSRVIDDILQAVSYGIDLTYR